MSIKFSTFRKQIRFPVGMSFENIDPHEFVKHQGSCRSGMNTFFPRDKVFYDCKECGTSVANQCNGCNTGIKLNMKLF